MCQVLTIFVLFIVFCARLSVTRPSSSPHHAQNGSQITISQNLSAFFTGNETNTIIASATEYLDKFGWVRPQNWYAVSPRSNESTLNEEHGFGSLGNRSDILQRSEMNPGSENLGSLNEVTPRANINVNVALREYQRSNGLKVSGHLDSSTMYTMSRLRCGVPDRVNLTGSDSSFESYDVDENQNQIDPLFPRIRSGPLQRRRRSYALGEYPVGRVAAVDDNRRHSTLLDQLVSEDELSRETRMKTIQEFLSALREEKQTSIDPEKTTNTLSSSPPSFVPLSIKKPVNSLIEKIVLRTKEVKAKLRRKRSNGFRQFKGKGGWGMVLAKNTITWRLVRQWPHTKNSQMSFNEVWFTVKLAFRIWSEVLPKNFQEDNTSPASDVDILIGFGKGRHNRCPVRFVNHIFSQEYAHAWALPKSEIHFNDDKPFVPVGWALTPAIRSAFHYRRFGSRPISLLKVAMHEIGHTLGLTHNRVRSSIMNPIYQPYQTEDIVELSAYDRQKIQRVYGTCDITFDAVFDWIRIGQDENGRPRWYFSTYFFRNNWYWLYDNRHQRPRYGDPKLIESNWRGVLRPGNPHQKIDGIVKIHSFQNLFGPTFIFKGDSYLEYDATNQRVKQRNSAGQAYPRRIAEDFRGIPYPIDAVFYKHNEDLLYFFKNKKVYRYRWGSRAFIDVSLISQMFRGWGGASSLPSNINAAYFSYQYNAFYFFKGAYYWKLADQREKLANRGLNIPYNSVGPRRKIASKWKFICDVGPTEMVATMTGTFNRN